MALGYIGLAVHYQPVTGWTARQRYVFGKVLG